MTTENEMRTAIREAKILHLEYKKAQAASNKAMADWKMAVAKLEEME
ncbi:MAG: hypothetical protein ABFC78_00535 [Methanoregula sp.]